MKIFMFDNHTGIDLPEKINSTPVNILLGSSIGEVKSKVNKADLFCVFTDLNDEYDIVVKNEKDANILKDILNFGGYNLKVDVKDDSMWYTQSAEHNIVFANHIRLDKSKLSSLLSMFLNTIPKQEKKQENTEMYIVFGVRSNKEIFRTPIFSEAKRYCDSKICSIIKTRDGNIIYNSNYGRITSPTNEIIKAKEARLRIIENAKNGVIARIKF